ncbi:MAG: hypothetical protein DRP47_10490 [Candidatus Zixiibacteriota bacterium]|nr:MAG: hypothetical protein DRP47_10490 [candidate division Zixibacteria bacterium]
MVDSELKERIATLLEAPLRKESCELVDMVLSRYKQHNTLRLFVYSEHGTSLKECARLSRIVGDIIDGTDWFEKGYTLEVSSPGLDRPLTEARDFKYRTGETVRIEFFDTTRKKFTADILSATDSEVQLEQDSQKVTIPLKDIKQAKIVF